MYVIKRMILFLFVLSLIAVLPVPAALGQNAQVSETAEKKSEAPQPTSAGTNSAEPRNSTLNADDMPVPINAGKIDEAGQALGKRIDAVTAGASVKFGRWINAKAFGQISWLKLIICFGLLVLVLAVERVVSRFIAMRIGRIQDWSSAGWSDLLFETVSRPLTVFIRVYGIYWALSPIWGYFDGAGGTSTVHKVVGNAADIGGTVAFFWFVYRFIHVIDFKMKKWVSGTDNRINEMLVPLVSKTIRGLVLVVGGMMVLQNMTGIELGPLIASLGIGGLAFALAGKDSIANFLGSLTILLDKPFHVGERIVIDKHDGFVEGVGFRSTRIRTLSGNLVSIPNEKIINSTLENVGQRNYLRWHTDIGLIFETPPEKVERAVEIIQEILKDHEGISRDYPPRVNFNGFKDWSLNISIYAWYFPPDFWKYQEWVQKTCLEIMRCFRQEGIEMAYPTQAIYHIEPEKPAEPVLSAIRRR